MEPFSKIDNAFHQLRKMPDEISLDKVEQFVLAQAAVGITAVGTTSILKKLLLKFHLNTIVVMTTTATASIAALLIWTVGWHKQEHAQDKSTHKTNSHELAFTSSKPELSLSVDTPTTTITQTGNSTSIEVTTETNSKKIATTNISVVAKGDSVITTVYTSNSDSVYRSNSKDKNAPQKIVIITEAATPPTPVIDATDVMKITDAMDAMAPLSAMSMTNVPNTPTIPTIPEIEMPAIPCIASCAPHDSLMYKIADQLVADGLIKDREHYSFKITGNSVKVNGVKQSNEVWKRYKNLIETTTPNKVNRKFVYAISVDGNDISMDMENYVD